MQNKIFYIINALALLIISVEKPYAVDFNSLADQSSYRCSGGVVSIGDLDRDVQDKCGQPDSQSTNEWVYNFGPSQPVYKVIFKDGKVVRILEDQGS